METISIISDLYARIREVLPPGEDIYLVGGAIRDALLGIKPHDLDFVLGGDPRGLAKRVANSLNARYYLLDDERNTGRVILTDEDNPPDTIDFSTFRGPDLESDLRGRDFTINAIALQVQGSHKLIDPLGGAEDLRNKRLRLCTAQSIEEDPLRILRAARLAIRFGLHIDPDTLDKMRSGLTGLEAISPERKRDELFRILEGPRPASALRILDRVGAIPYILPELESLKNLTQSPPHIDSVWEHTLATIDYLDQVLWILTSKRKIASPDAGIQSVRNAQTVNAYKTENLAMGLLALELGRYGEQLIEYFNSVLNPFRSLRGLLFLAALYHDVAKPETWQMDASGRIHNYRHEVFGGQIVAARAQALQLSNLEVARLKVIVENHMRIHSLTQLGKPPGRRSIYRFFRDTGPAGVEICLLTLADTLATYGSTLPTDLWAAYVHNCRVLLESWWEKPAENIHPKVFLNGNDLIQLFGLTPGPTIGHLLEALREAGATGEVDNYDQAVSFAKEWLENNR